MADDLISRQAIYLELSREASHCLELGTKEGVSWATALQDAKRRIRSVPAVDAVPVVLCKDCRSCYDGTDDYCCKNHKGLVTITPESFCSYGERRKEDAAD